MRLRPTAKKFIDELEEVGKRLINSSRETRHTQKEQAEPSPEVRAIIAAPDGIYTKKHATDAKQDRQYRIWNLLLQGLLCLLTAGAFCAAAYYACYAKKQWETMNQTVREMQRQTSVAQIDQRPWIGLARIEQQPGMKHGKITFRLIFKNFGKTPPTGLFTDADLIDKGEKEDLRPKMDSLCECIKAYTGADAHVAEFKTYTIIPSTEISNSDFLKLHFTNIDISVINKMKDPYIFGCIIYTTQFDSPSSPLHQTEFYSRLKGSIGVGKHLDVYALDAN